jgi:4-amino-4-deoxy-L-arabinose transferase-like glycosyltransferase
MEDIEWVEAARSRSFIAWLPFLWSRILFPGQPPTDTRVRIGAVLLLVLVPGILLYPCLSFRLFEPDEGRYAEIPREMLARGEWVVPYLQGEPYLDKPPLLYWCVMGAYRLLGVHDFVARLVPAIAIHLSILITYWFGRRFIGERGAFAGAMCLSLAPGFVTMGRLLIMDGLLALWVCLAWYAGYEAVRRNRLHLGWWIVAALACGLGIMTKGPVAIVLFAIPLVLQRRLAGRGCAVGYRELAIFATITTAVSLPWYGLFCLRSPAFAEHFFLRHNLQRFLAPFDHQEPVWFYAPILVAGLLPASLLGVGWLRFLLSGDADVAQARTPALGMLLLAGGWCVLFFTVSGSKLPTYILPAFPPLALLLGHYIASTRWVGSPWTRAGAIAGVVILASAHYLVVPWYARFHSPMSREQVVRRYCDPRTPVVCYPRSCDSVAFYLGRDDLRNYRSKDIGGLLRFLQDHPRSVVLFTHRHSAASLAHALPAQLHLSDLTPVSKSWSNFLRTEYNYMGVVEHRASAPALTNDARRAEQARVLPAARILHTTRPINCRPQDMGSGHSG